MKRIVCSLDRLAVATLPWSLPLFLVLMVVLHSRGYRSGDF